MAKSAKQRREFWENGRPGEVYGIWNGMEKRFVFGIREGSPKKAWSKFRNVAGTTSYRWRYDVKRIPDNWINPPNPYYTKRKTTGGVAAPTDGTQNNFT